MKNVLAIASLVVGIIGFGVFFKPVLEIVCGVGGLILAVIAKSSDDSGLMGAIRHWGRNIAWINIIWVCLEFGLKLVGIDLFPFAN